MATFKTKIKPPVLICIAGALAILIGFILGNSSYAITHADPYTKTVTAYQHAISKYCIDTSHLMVDVDKYIMTYKYDDGKQIIIDMHDSNVDGNIKLSVASAFNSRAADEVIAVASELNHADAISGIAVYLSSDQDHNDNDDHVEDLDFTKIDIDHIGLSTIQQIDHAAIKILIQTDLDDDDYNTFANNLKNALLNTYDFTIPFRIHRI